MNEVRPDNPEVERLLERVRAGDPDALGRLLADHREMVRGLVARRLDARMKARLDASDVVQEAQLEMARRIGEYLQRRPMPFHLWACKTAYENFLRLRRQHVEAACRGVAREVALPEHSSVLLAQRVLGGPAPSAHLREAEQARRVQVALARLSDADREVVLLRIFERLNNAEVAAMLGLEPDTASKRYTRALLRLRQALEAESPAGQP